MTGLISWPPGGRARPKRSDQMRTTCPQGLRRFVAGYLVQSTNGIGWQRQARKNQRFISSRPDRPAASSSDRNQLGRPPLHAMNQPVFEELEMERWNKPRSCRAAIELQTFMIRPPPGWTEGRPYPVELPFHPFYLPIRDTRPAVSRLFAFLFASERRNGKIGLIRSLVE